MQQSFESDVFINGDKCFLLFYFYFLLFIFYFFILTFIATIQDTMVYCIYHGVSKL